MAKKTKAVIELDVMAPGLEQIKKLAGSTNETMGEFHTKSQKILKLAEKIENIFAEYGKNIPINKVTEIEKTYKRISDTVEDLENMGGIQIFDAKELSRIKELTKKLLDVQSKIDELERQKADNGKKVEARLKQLRSQKTATNEKGESVNLSSLKDEKGKAKWKTTGDLQKIASSPTSSKEEIAAAEAVLYQYGVTLEKVRESNLALQKRISSLSAEFKTYEKDVESITGSYRELTDEELSLLQSLKVNSSEMEKYFSNVGNAASKAGKTTVTAMDGASKATGNLGKAVKSVLSIGAMWNLTKKIINESVNTISEMDKALTGMTVVTGQSREEVQNLVPQIRNLARETGSAMTEVAETITEYIRQGRSLSDSFILAEETAKAAKIAGISLSDSITYLTSTINGFNLAASDAAHVSDVFANVAAISATNYEDLAISLSKVSAQANLAGMSMEYTTALLAKGIETTQEAPESIGTALKTVVARMRELTDYGKTLEDGASVNRVERALSSAGVELRSVTGEFRNLEDVFNDLGPKWDSLNTMQQQAIAQAVAGTRQQSRFIAIMQDWERTEELATEAQNSAGASAAQHAKYMEGMEAAMDNLKSSWQGFVQSVTKSEIIIGGVRLLGNVVNWLANVLEELDANKFATVLIPLVGVTLAFSKVTEKLIDKDAQEIENKRKLHDEEIKSLENAKRKLEYIRETIKAEASLADTKAKAKQKEAEGYKTEGDEYDTKARNVANQMMSMDGYGTPIDSEQMALLEAQYDELIAKRDEAYAKELEAKNQIVDLETQSKDLRSQQNEIDKQIATTQDQINEQETSKNELQDERTKGIINQNNAMLERLKLQQQEIKHTKDLLKAEMSRTEDSEQRKKLAKDIAKLDKAEIKNQQKINKLEKQNEELTKRNADLFDGIKSSLTSAVTNGLRNMLGSLGPIGDAAGDILGSIIEWGVELIAQNGAQKILLKNQLALNAAKVADLSVDQLKLLTQLNIEDSTEDELKAIAKSLGINTANLTVDELRAMIKDKQSAAQIKLNAQENKGFLSSIKNAIANIGQSAGMPYGTSMAFAIAGAAVLATVGVGGLLGLLNAKAAAPSDKQLETNISKIQLNTYDLKENRKTLSSGINDVEKLKNKTIRSAEEEEQLKELTDSLREQNDNWKNLPDDRVLAEAKKELQKNTNQIHANVESAFALALQMENLTGAIAQQAIVDKMVQDQANMIVGPDGDAQKAASDAAGMAAAFAKNNAETLADSLSTQEHTWGEIALGFGSGLLDATGLGVINNVAGAVDTWSTGGGFWKGMDELLFRGSIGDVGSVWEDDSKSFWEKVGDTALTSWNASKFGGPVGGIQTGIETGNMIVDKIKSEKEQKEAKELIEETNKQIMDFASRMSEAGDSIYDQILLYQDISDDYNQIVQNAAASQYSNIDLLNRAMGGSKEVAQNLKILGEAGLLSSESLLGVVEQISNVTTGREAMIAEALSYEENGVKAGDETYSLDKLRKELKLDEDATFAEITSAYYAEYSDGTDDDGKQKWKKGVNEELYDALAEIAGNLGDYAQYTSEQLKIIERYSKEIDPVAMVQTLINGTMEQLNITSEEDAKTFSENPVQQAEAAKAIYQNGMDMINQEFGETAKYIQEQEQLLAEKRAALDGATEEEKKEIMEDISEITTTLSPIQREYEKSLSALTDATLKAAGYMDAATSDDYFASIGSTRERVMGLMGKVGGEDGLEKEDYAYIRDELAPALQKWYGDNGFEFSLDSFLDSFKNGEDIALLALQGLYENEGLTTDIKFGNSIAVIEEMMNDMFEDASNYVDGIVTGNLEDFTDAARIKYDDYSFSKDVQQHQREDAKKILSEGGLSLSELRLQNARNLVESISNSSDSVLASLDKMKVAHEVLLNEVQDNLDNEYKLLATQKLSSLGMSEEELKKYIYFVDGKMQMDADWYNSLHDSQKQLVTDSLDNLETYGEEYYETYTTIKEQAQQAYEEQIDLQQQLVDAYKEQLETEQEELQNALDKRKDTYDKYFDSLEEKESDENFEEEQARLQNAIAALSGATDATSLSKLKEYQEQLQELEEEQLQTERDRRRDSLTESLDNQSEAIDQYYEERLSNEQALWKELSTKTIDELKLLYTAYNEEYKNSTDLNQKYLLHSFSGVIAGVKGMLYGFNSSEYKTALAQSEELKPYSTGGVVDYTGLAMVHGSSSRPEAFLNSSQTALFAQLSHNLEMVYNRSTGIAQNDTTQASSVTIDNLTISVDAQLTNDNVYETGQSLADALMDGLRRTGLSVNMKK